MKTEIFTEVVGKVRKELAAAGLGRSPEPDDFRQRFFGGTCGSATCLC